MTNKFRIVLECSSQIDDDDVKRLKKEFKTKYNVNFTFKLRKYDLHYANWIISGTRENVKRFIMEDYLPCMEIDINDLDEDCDAEILDLIRN